MKYERSNKLYLFNFFPAKKKKKPKLLNKFDKTIKAELDAAEKLRKKVSFECFTQSKLWAWITANLRKKNGELLLDYILCNFL